MHAPCSGQPEASRITEASPIRQAVKMTDPPPWQALHGRLTRGGGPPAAICPIKSPNLTDSGTPVALCGGRISRLDDLMMQMASAPTRRRLTLLLSYGGWRDDAAVHQLPRLLEPMGITSIEAETGEQAADLIQQQPIHIALVDLEIPLRGGSSDQQAGGARILQLLRRLHQPPPTVVIRPKQANSRDDVRGLATSLREGAFAVLDRPLHIEAILETLRRVLRRHYQDAWPTPRPEQTRRDAPAHGRRRDPR